MPHPQPPGFLVMPTVGKGRGLLVLQADDYEPAAEVSSLENALRTAGRPVTFHTYAGTGHWFFEQDRSEAYNEVAAKLAWERTLAFLRKELPV